MAGRRLVVRATLAVLIIGIASGMGAYIRRDWSTRDTDRIAGTVKQQEPTVHDGTMPVRISIEARKNIGLAAQSLQLTTYHRTIEVPGVIVDRPGVSDRGIVTPVTGIVTAIHTYPGDIVAPKATLFSLRLASESLHTSQLELFKATKEIEIGRQQRKRLEGLVATGGVPGSRLIEIDNQIQRMEVLEQAYRQDLVARGLAQDQIDAAARGAFITEITVQAPGEQSLPGPSAETERQDNGSALHFPFSFELLSLSVELGQQVEAGEVLCKLADHRALMIEGQGFKKDLSWIQRAAQEQLPVEVAFEESAGVQWPSVQQKLRIGHVANLIDAESRTFAFFLPLENQWQVYNQSGNERLIWRFRPGDQVRLFVTVETMENVFVVPPSALVREGPEAFVFRQNGDLFDRLSVHVLHEDSTSVVIANDGKLRKGAFVAVNAAASINRVLKAQLASGQPTNLHVHADGTTHEAH